ncbi:MAG: hypothetical protein J7L54_03450 [Elusimicrobia bacterium]|nr:hypothetical protein [Elusimicrobiota bacterium]
MKDIENIFLLGRPGCGKSIVFRNILKILDEKGSHRRIDRIDDFPILKKLHDDDVAAGRTDRFIPTPDGGFKVVDPGVWDRLIEGLNEKAKEIRRDDLILAIEFSRPNYVHSLLLFDGSILEKSVAFYIDASFECCVRRNEERTKRAEAEGIDAHFVSRKEMEETYLTDDKDELIKKSPVPVYVIPNGDGISEDEIRRTLEGIFPKIGL